MAPFAKSLQAADDVIREGYLQRSPTTNLPSTLIRRAFTHAACFLRRRGVSPRTSRLRAA
jgi:hypothetical protein